MLVTLEPQDEGLVLMVQCVELDLSDPSVLASGLWAWDQSEQSRHIDWVFSAAELGGLLELRVMEGRNWSNL